MPVSQSSFKQMRMMLGIVLALAGCVMVVYIAYVNNQQAYFTDRNLRHLERVGGQVASKIQVYQEMVKTAAGNVERHEKLPGDPKTGRESGQQPLSQPDNQYPSVLHADGLQLVKIYDPASGLTLPQDDCDPPRQFRLKVLEEQSSHWLEIWYHGTPDNSQRTVDIAYKVRLEEVIGQFINDRVWIGAKDFDHMLFAVQSNGDVVFQSPGAGFKATSLAAFQGADKVDGKLPTIDLKSIAAYTAVHSVLLAGDTYTLFAQPVELSLEGENCDTDGLVACGLVRADHLRQETNAISPNLLSLIIFAIVIAGLGWPFVKLWLMGPKNRLRVRDVLFLGICMVLATGLVTFAVLDVYAYSHLSNEADAQVEELSNRICGNLRRELKRALNQLAYLTDDDPVIKHQILRLQQETSPGGRRRYLYGSPAPRDKALYRERFGPYPYFDTVFWADKDGMQRIKLTAAAETVTSAVNIQDRYYFQQAQKGDLWHIRDGDRGFVAEPVSARTSGKMLAAISTPLDYTDPKAPWVAVMGTRLLSLSDPVLPDGFGFCVIDRDGKVLFHSDEKRDLQENLFEECDHGGDLRSMVSARASGPVDARYLGRGHLLYVRPIQNLPWTLVAFMEERLLAEANFDILIGSVILLLLYCVLIAPVCYLLCPLHNRDKSEWIWPDGNRTAAYRFLIRFNLALAAVFLLVIAFKNGWGLVVPAASIPVIDVFVAYLVVGRRLDVVRSVLTKLRGQNDAPKQEAAGKPEKARGFLGRKKRAAQQAGTGLTGEGVKFFGYKRLAALAGASTLLLLSALPAMAWFKIVHDRQVRLLVRFEQTSMANAAEQRRHSLNQLPRRPRESGEDAAAEWGDYHSLFFNTRLTTTRDESASGSHHVRSSFESVADRLLPSLGGGLHFSRLVRRFPSDAAGLGAGKDKLEFQRRESAAGTDSSIIKLESAVPGLRPPDGLLGWVFALILLGVLLIGLLCGVRWILKRVFLIDLEERRIVERKRECESIELRHNLLVVATSPAVNLRGDLGLVGVDEIDLAKPAEEQAGQPSGQNGDGGFELQHYRAPHGNGRAVAIRNFDFKLEDPDFNKKKLLLLRFLFAAGMKAVVLSAVDPMRFNLGPAPASASGEQHNGHRSKEMELWESTFDSFLKVHVDQVEGLDSPASPASGDLAETGKAGAGLNNGFESAAVCLSERLQGTGVKIVRPDVNPSLISYRSIWSNCSKDERLTLCYVAQDRFADSKNRALQDLLRRGLVKRDPSLKPMSEDFRQFIISEIKPGEIHQGESEHSHWNVLRTPMMVALALVVVFLFYTQQNVVSSALALSGALTAAIPAVLRVAGMLQTRKTGEAAAK